MKSSEDRKIIVTIEKLAFGGEGVCHLDGQVVFVPFVLPGEQVEIRLVKDEGKFARAEAIAILSPSPARVEPRCSVFGRCGGCQWQHMSYTEQGRHKELILGEILQRALGKPNLDKSDSDKSDFQVLPMIPAPDPWEYRRRLQLKSDGRDVGFYGRQGHELVAFQKCEIAHPLLNKRVQEIRARHEEHGEAFELDLNEKGLVECHAVSGDERIFSQVNPEQNKTLQDQVVNFVFGRADKAFTQQKNVVELHAGSGNLTFRLAESAGQVVAVESNKQAIDQMIATCINRRIHNVECIGGTAEWGLKKVYRRRGPIDVLVLDPPRGGAREVLDLILVSKPRRVIYVSCNPTTLARDLKRLLRDYRLERVQPIDMFPQTYHIESISELVRVD